MIRFFKRSAFPVISSSLVLSALIWCATLPDFFILRRMSFLRMDDVVMVYRNVFTLASNFYHGGISLWDPYDQMPNLFAHLATGLYGFTNLVTAGAVILFSPLFSSPAKAFYLIYNYVYFPCYATIFTLGAYLLLKRFSRDPVILIFSLVWANTLMNGMSYLSFALVGTFCFFPLLVHLFLKAFENLRFKDFVLFGFAFIVCFVNQPLITLHHFYACLHGVMLSVLAWAFITKKDKLWEFVKKVRHPEGRHWRLFLGALFVSLIMLLPLVILYKNMSGDLNFNVSKSRLQNPFSIKAYFDHGPDAGAGDLNPPQDILIRSVDFVRNGMCESWIFIGTTILFLSVLGLAFHRNRQKYIFLFSAVFICLLNSRRESAAPWGLLAHWINALTNPFKFMLKSLSVGSAMALPMILLPLMTMGLESLRDISKGENRPKPVKILFACVLIAGLFASVLGGVSEKVFVYLILSSILAILILYSAVKRVRFIVVFAIVSLLFSADLFVARQYYWKAYLDWNRMTGHRLRHLGNASPLGLDYQNPKIFPFRTYGASYAALAVLSQWTLSTDSHNQNQLGLLYRYTNFINFMAPGTWYQPVHRSYTRLTQDRRLWRYFFSGDHRLIFLADRAVSEDDLSFTTILDKHWDRRIVMIAKDGRDAPVEEVLPDHLDEKVKEVSDWKATAFRLDDADKWLSEGIPTLMHPGAIEFGQLRTAPHIEYSPSTPTASYAFPLPGDFPKHRASSVFTEDITTMFVRLGDQTLLPSQGYASEPFSYDISNQMTDKLVVALPRDYETKGKTLLLVTFPDPLIPSVWKYSADEAGFDVNAKHDGWLVLHWPYDEKWKLEVDGKSAPFYRANYCFTGFPLKQGAHKIHLRYWPDTPLRVWIPLSVLLCASSVIFIYVVSFRDERDGLK